MTDTDPLDRIEYVNEPEPHFRIEPIGNHSTVVWEVDWEEMGNPTPDAFRKVGTAEVKLVVAASGPFPDDLDEEFNAAHQALVDLRDAMLEYRGIDPDSEQGIEVKMGNLDGLPEVTRRVE